MSTSIERESVLVKPRMPTALGVRSRNLSSGGEPQRLGEARHSCAAQLVARDHVDRGGRLRAGLRSLADDRHREVRQLLDAELRETCLWGIVLRGSGPGTR
jgi:hypothetical protein